MTDTWRVKRCIIIIAIIVVIITDWHLIDNTFNEKIYLFFVSSILGENTDTINSSSFSNKYAEPPCSRTKIYAASRGSSSCRSITCCPRPTSAANPPAAAAVVDRRDRQTEEWSDGHSIVLWRFPCSMRTAKQKSENAHACRCESTNQQGSQRLRGCMGQRFCNAVAWVAELVRVKKSWKFVEISLTTSF